MSQNVKKKVKTGMTFGGFDLCHVGHVNLLKQAKEICDCLIVCVSSDILLYQKKGKYPILKLSDRQLLVRLTGYADVIDEQGFNSKEKLVKKYNPDILFVGNDYSEETFEGMGLRKVVFLKHTDFISTTWFRKKIFYKGLNNG